MLVRELIKDRDPCEGGLLWWRLHDVEDMADVWDLMLKEGCRYIFWIYTRCPSVTSKQRLDFVAKVYSLLGDTLTCSLKMDEHIEPETVREIMDGIPNPYRGK